MRKITLHIATSPHVVKGASTETIMKNVIYALLPAAAFGVYAFGISALLVLLTTTISAVAIEHFLCKISKKESTVSDYSAAITGLLLGMCLPPDFPLWMAFMGSAISIGLGKFIFGGLGYNVFNPALVGRAFLQATFPVAITTWYQAFGPDRFYHISSSVLALPFMQPAVDGVSGATPLSAFKFDHVDTQTYDLAMGFINGSIGETGTVFLILGGIYLAWRKMLNWRIPVSIFITVFVFSGAAYLINNTAYPSPFFTLFSGGLMLGAIYMATDMVASPITSVGVWVYGAIIGILVVMIRLWGGLPEGVMYAILLANAISPHIDNLIRPRVYGTTNKLKLS
ncbi:MAG: RnfABCDGE type electron transport complex subunit D [Saprospiraceae bacterium]|nr:RnfABCDGE type electron transport complex subunit D [Saprospiraceae bacterium]MBP6566914.1 RnfABCDGE type electron transport complex subunit D [Saprospiraceae bacterium]